MSGKVQPTPPGLLSLLDLKAFGDAPRAFGDTVIPTMDLSHWYGIDSRETLSGNILIGTALKYGNILAATGFIVPIDEWWWVDSYTVQTSAFAATVTQHRIDALAPALLQGANATRGLLLGESIPSPLDSTVLAPNQGFQVVPPSMRDFWAAPRSNFGASFWGQITDAVNPIGLYCVASFRRLKI